MLPDLRKQVNIERIINDCTKSLSWHKQNAFVRKLYEIYMKYQIGCTTSVKVPVLLEVDPKFFSENKEKKVDDKIR